MGADALAQVLRPLAERFPAAAHPRVLVGLSSPDDAAVLRMEGETAIVATTDFFPPVVDEPYAYGAIAAANAMSDVFAMGGAVMLALAVAVFPDDLGPDVVEAIVSGGADKVAEAGGVLAGGHTVTGREPMYGLAVIGRVEPDRMLRKDAAAPGDRLVLTKPIGTGLVTTALKAGSASRVEVEEAMRSMAVLNSAASDAAVAVGARAATDVTGFSLAGHAHEMAAASGVRMEVEVAAVPLLPGAIEHARSGAAPGGTALNRAAFGSSVRGLERLSDAWLDLLFDPQTSGGLLVAVPEGEVERFLDLLAAADQEGWPIGRVLDGSGVELLG